MTDAGQIPTSKSGDESSGSDTGRQHNALIAPQGVTGIREPSLEGNRASQGAKQLVFGEQIHLFFVCFS